MAKFTVVYDACVLYPAPLRDLLVQLATENLFRAKWTDQIHDEWIRNLLIKRPDLSADRLAVTRAAMDRAVLDSLVTGYEHLIPAVSLPDEDDRHVVAAAIHARADAIVTSNLKDFPSTSLGIYNLEAIHPDEFINHQIDLDEATVVIAANRCRARLKNPQKSVSDYLETLETQSLPKTVGMLRRYKSLL